MSLNLSEKALLEDIPMAVAVAQQDATLLYRNGWMKKYLGTERSFSTIFEVAIILLNLQKEIKRFREEWQEEIVDTLNSQLRDSIKRVYASVDPNGDEKQFEFTFKKSGENFVILIEDITEQKNTENELKKAKEHAEEADRLKTAFLQNMSHEVRTPLNGILGFSSLLNTPGLTNEEKEYYIGVINESSNQLLSIVDNIINLSKLDTEKPKLTTKEICLNDLTDELYYSFVQKAIDKGLELNVMKGLNDRAASIKCDFDKLKLALENILDNAIKFTHTGKVNLEYLKLDNKILFSIKDTGIGIKPKYWTKIFDRFYQIDDKLTRNYGGTGLGLAVAKGNIELLGGETWVESETYKGTTFFVSLPYTPVYKETPRKEEVCNIPSDAAIHFVLVAEDEDINFMFIEEALKGITMSLSLLRANNGKEALDIFKTRNDISLVLMDIKMPVMDGYAALNEIRKIRPEVPVIAQTAYAFFSDKTKALKSGFNDYISKPIKKEILVKLVNEYIQQTV